MDELFGAPMSNVATVLAVVFGIAVAILVYIRLRDPILVRMAVRNVLRRPVQSLLIIAADGSGAIEAAFFQNGVETVNVKELIS